LDWVLSRNDVGSDQAERVELTINHSARRSTVVVIISYYAILKAECGRLESILSRYRLNRGVEHKFFQDDATCRANAVALCGVGDYFPRMTRFATRIIVVIRKFGSSMGLIQDGFEDGPAICANTVASRGVGDDIAATARFATQIVVTLSFDLILRMIQDGIGTGAIQGMVYIRGWLWNG
jgi:hypothetical protein